MSPRRRNVLSLSPLLLLASLGAAGCRGPAAPPLLAPLRSTTRFEGDLEDRLRAAGRSERFTVLVDLTRQVDLERLLRARRGARPGPTGRRSYVIGALERVASEQQARLEPLLQELRRSGEIDHVERVAIVNRVIVEGRVSGILRLAESPEVAIVRPDWTSRTRRAGSADTFVPPTPVTGAFRNWAIEAIGADRLWTQGLDGSGIVVAILDTGVSGDHEQLAGRRLEGNRGWFDPVLASGQPVDPHGHGTSVIGLAVGGNPEGRILGVAPGARWAAALANHENHYTRSRMTLAADWALRVARPDVLVNAWSHVENGDPCTSFDLPFIDAWRASGIFVVFPAGNAGPSAASGEPPAQLTGAVPGGGPVFAVGGVDRNDLAIPTSSRGPSRCGSSAFPSLAVPGLDLVFAVPGNPRGYLSGGEGTSLAAGIAAGGAALLLQADPDLEPERLEEILLDTARDLAPEGRDDATGAGLLDLPAALARIRADSQQGASR